MTAGRPVKFKTVEELQEKIDKYFDETPEEELTVTGLALALDTSRETLCDYGKKDKYSDTVKRAKLKVENSYEKSLRKRGSAGDIFGLKNFGWTDKKEIEHSGEMNINHLLDELDDETNKEEQEETSNKELED